VPKATEIQSLLDAYPRIYFACHTRHVRDLRTETVLSANQASILDHLDEVEPTSLNELAAHMGVTPSTMSIAIERLVRQGYVTRLRDESDRRRVRLRLTPDGTRIKSEKSVLDPTRVNAVLARLSPSERADALRGLELLAKASSIEMHAAAMAKRKDRRQQLA
jgi:DNA-binding MarR family transcriptional regulator